MTYISPLRRRSAYCITYTQPCTKRTFLHLALFLFIVCGVCIAANAAKLKTFYMGSGGLTQDTRRTIVLQFNDDGTAILDQALATRHERWHARWKRDGKNVLIEFEPVAGKPTQKPLSLTLKHGSLVATDWDPDHLGILNPPTLAPFSGKDLPQGATSGCISSDPNQPGCVTWDSRDK